DAHLMIDEPARYLNDFAAAGCDLLTVHWEACRHLHRTIQEIKNLGIKASVALNPATPISFLENILPELDMVVLMSVNPGFGGQKFITPVLDKVRALKQIIDEQGLSIDIQVDGGITAANAPRVVEAGANILVAGSAVFASPNIGQAIADLRRAGNI
ncbi:MAG: ribulose-phosphate 3-epimerase, partial [Clostridiales bacterium]